MNKKNFTTLRRVHGYVHEAIQEANNNRKKFRIIKKGIKAANPYTNPALREDNYPVDFVVLWLDGNDPSWQAEKERYISKDEVTAKSNSAARFREWGIFHYWFRSVEKYAPWVRNVYVVTCGHFPLFLNREHPKLKLIRHDQFMPKKYLPTFSCFPTELNLWRIEGISEHIVYFNDDMFLTSPVKKEDFFCGGVPKYCGVVPSGFPHSKMTAWEHNLFNVAGVANDLFDIRACIDENPDKWFSVVYRELDRKWNYRAYEDGKITRMHFSHLGVPYRCSTMKKLWDIIPERLDSTCHNRFRTMDDVFHQLFQVWEIYNGSFEPVPYDYYGVPYSITLENMNEIEDVFLSEKYRMICLNDWEGITDDSFPIIRAHVQKMLKKKYPLPSTFEV